MKKIELRKIDSSNISTKFQGRIPVFLIYIFLTFWFYLVAKNYYSRNPVHPEFLAHVFSLGYYYDYASIDYFKVLMNHFVQIFFLFLIFFAAYGLGAELLKLFKISEETSLLESFIFSMGLGLGGLILFVFGIGILGALYKSVILAFLIVFVFFGLLKMTKQKLSISILRNRFTGFEIFWVAILFLAGLIFIIGSLGPDIYYDSMVYYLSIPQHWIQEHRISTLPYNALSHMMFNISILYTVGLMLNGEIVAKLIHFSLGILTIITIYGFCKKYFNRQVGLLAAVIFYTIPVTAMVSQRPGIELGLALFETLAIFAFINWCQQTNGPTDQRTNGQTNYKDKWLIISGIFAGLAMGGKYTSFFSALGLFLCIIIKVLFFDKQEFNNVLKKALLFGFIVAIVYSPWAVKNILNTGNPVAPLYSHRIGHLKLRTRPVSGEPAYSRKLKNIFRFPWTVTMGKETQEPFPGPVFLLALPLLFLFKKSDKVTKLLLIYFLILYVFWALLMSYLRYFIPSLPVISIILAIYIIRVDISQIFRKIILFFISLAFLGNVYFTLLSQKLNQNPLPVVLGLESKKEYLSTQRAGYPNPYFQAINWANQNLPKTAKILFIGEGRELYAERKTIASFVDDYNPIVIFSNSAKNGEELWERLKKEGITHILFNVPEARRLGGYDMLHWEGEDLKVFLEFWNKYVKEIYKDIADISIPNQGIYSMKRQVPNWWQHYCMDPRNYVYLYEILSPEEAEKLHPAPLNFFLIPEFYLQQRWEKIKKYFNLS